MRSDTETEREPPEVAAAATSDDSTESADRLADENRRLRAEPSRGRRATYRYTALGLFGLGVVAVLGAVAFPDSRDVLFALGGTGLFAGVLTYSLTSERFVTATVADRMYAPLAETGAELAAERDLTDRRVYAPARIDAPGFAPVRLFVPRHADDAIPDPDELDSLFVTDDGRERGVALPPSAGALYPEFERELVDSVAERPSTLAVQLTDALVDGFELASSATPDVERGRVTVEIEGSAYPDPDRFDNPIPSFLGVGFAAGLDAPVTTAVAVGDGATDFVVTCEWDPDETGTEATA
ncbi:hypothetical protein [Halorussus amylolyticus]|uniref:hypothetical protein n=1 Tax=Halorussus amylolyticus TaxID=1126242 RepID=UPI001043CCC4|nr:hypothetical protein [Halorussus amylolyticus]